MHSSSQWNSQYHPFLPLNQFNSPTSQLVKESVFFNIKWTTSIETCKQNQGNWYLVFKNGKTLWLRSPWSAVVICSLKTTGLIQLKRVFFAYGNTRVVTTDIRGVFFAYGNTRVVTTDIRGVFSAYGNSRVVTIDIQSVFSAYGNTWEVTIEVAQINN